MPIVVVAKRPIAHKSSEYISDDLEKSCGVIAQVSVFAIKFGIRLSQKLDPLIYLAGSITMSLGCKQSF